MEVLRDFKQIQEKNRLIFDTPLENVPILDRLTKDELKNLRLQIKITHNDKAVSALAELIFQLRDYMPALENYIKLFLFCGYYEGIYYFLSKLFVAHIGSVPYISKLESYTHEERIFDRFIELVKNSDISFYDYINFIFKIFTEENSVINRFSRPASEYMQELLRENEKEIIEFVKLNQKYQKVFFEAMLTRDSQKAISMLFEDVLETNMVEQLLNIILKQYFDDVMVYFDNKIKAGVEERSKYIKMLSKFDNEPQVKARLEDLYEDEQDETIKSYLKSKLGIVEKAKNFKCSPLHFKTLAKRYVQDVQNKTLNISFKNIDVVFAENGERADDLVKTYITRIFKENSELKNLYSLKSVCEIFEDGLNNYADMLFNMITRFPDIKKAKWAVRLVALASSEICEFKVCDFCYQLFKDDKKWKQAKYLLECLIYSRKKTAFDLMSKLTVNKIQHFENLSSYFYQIYSDAFDTTSQDIENIFEGDIVTEELKESQTKKLYLNFIENKSYSKQHFNDLFINKKLFNTIAQGIVFGEYKKDRLVSLFVLEEENKKYILGTTENEGNDIRIKIVHSLDLDGRFEEAIKFSHNLNFHQFGQQVFDVNNFAKSLNINSMQGILINVPNFVKNLSERGFELNYDTDKSVYNFLYCVSNKLNILAVVEFLSPIKKDEKNSSIGFIRFYRLSECLSHNKSYILNSAKCLPVKDIPYRFFDYIMSSISYALKNN